MTRKKVNAGALTFSQEDAKREQLRQSGRYPYQFAIDYLRFKSREPLTKNQAHDILDAISRVKVRHENVVFHPLTLDDGAPNNNWELPDLYHYETDHELILRLAEERIDDIITAMLHADWECENHCLTPRKKRKK